MFGRDKVALQEAMEVAGLKLRGTDVDMDIVLEWWELLREPMLLDEPAVYSPEYARRVIAASMAPASPYRPTLTKLSLPPEYLLLNRITFGVNSLLARLEPSANWHRIINELAGEADEPASPLGEVEASYFAGRADAA